MDAPEARLAEIFGALSLACDVAFAFPLEKTMRTSVLAVELGRRHGLPDATLHDVYYSTLLTYAGCTAFTHEVSRLSGGDDIAISNLIVFLDIGSPGDMLAQLVAKAGAGQASGGARAQRGADDPRGKGRRGSSTPSPCAT